MFDEKNNNVIWHFVDGTQRKIKPFKYQQIQLCRYLKNESSLDFDRCERHLHCELKKR